MTLRSPVAMALAALLLTACAMALGPRAAPTAPRVQGGAGAPAFRCALVAEEGAGGTTLSARLDAREAVAGTYALRVRANGAAIDQGGEFEAAAGEALTLAETQLGTPASRVDARLTLTAEGRTTTCPAAR